MKARVADKVTAYGTHELYENITIMLVSKVRKE
jgi:hypothetical protein